MLGLLAPDMTWSQYLIGAAHPELIALDGWTFDQYFFDLQGRAQIQVDLALNYRSNIALYP